MFKYLFVPEKFLPDDVGFKLYGLPHLLWLAAMTALIVLMIVAYKKMSKSKRVIFARAVAVFLLTCEVVRDIYLIACGAWFWKYLPLHPCSLTMFIIAIWAFKPNRFCGQLLYGFGIAGAFCALIFCNWTSQPLVQFQSIYSFIFHAILIGFILMTVIGGDIKPEFKGIGYCFGFLLVAASVATAVNYTVPDVNFFFTYEGSEGSPLEIFVKLFGSPWWLLAYAALAAVVLLAEFLPWHIIEKKKLKSNT